MLLTQLLAEHPEAAADIVRHTPLWVAGVLAGLTALGLSAARTRQVHFNRLVAMPLVMGGLALWGVQSAFGASGRLAELLALWAACCAALLALGTRLAPPVGAAYDAATPALEALLAVLTVQDCQAATGARRDFYQCMSSDYNHVYACGKAHPFEP